MRLQQAIDLGRIGVSATARPREAMPALATSTSTKPKSARIASTMVASASASSTDAS